jgi:hypothetical protein
VIGSEWDEGNKKESYWIRYAGRCRLVPTQHLRYATLTECLSQEQVMQQIRESIVQLSEEKKPFTFEDNRQLVSEV